MAELTVPELPADHGPEKVASRRPAALTVSLYAYLGSASLSAVIGVFIVVRYATASPSPGSPAPAAAVVAIVLIWFAYAAALVVLAWRLRAGMGWARTALFIVSCLSLLAANGPGLYVVLMLAVANVLAFLRPVSAWLREKRGLRPA